MSTSVEARVVRPRLNAEAFAALTKVPLSAGGITPNGILFDGDLTLDEVGAVWWFVTSRDDDDMARRQSLAALRDAADPGLCAALVAYVLGEA